MEEKLNQAEINSLNAEEIVSDFIKILFSRRSNPPKTDCLMEQCESLLEKFQRQIGKWYNNSNIKWAFHSVEISGFFCHSYFT